MSIRSAKFNGRGEQQSFSFHRPDPSQEVMQRIGDLLPERRKEMHSIEEWLVLVLEHAEMLDRAIDTFEKREGIGVGP